MNDFTKYPYSSHASLLSNLPTHLERDTVLELFGGKDEYIKFHQVLSEDFLVNMDKFDFD